MPYPMDHVSGTPDTGARYSTSLTLPVGTHRFAYSATDGTNSWGDPLTPGVYSGLSVTSTPNPQRRATITTSAAPVQAPYGYDGG